MRTTFSAEGDLRATDVLAGLVGLWREGASGALHFSRSGATAGFHLSAGELTAVWSSDARFETASILLRAGKLDTSTLERLSTPEGSDRALAALQAGILTKREWRWGEKIRAVEVLSDLLTWIEGEYVFDRGAHADAGEFRLTVPRLILELFLRSRDRALVLHYLGGADVPLARAPRFDAEFAAFGLTADAEAVVRLIDGKTTAAQIASEGAAEAFAVEKLLAALVTLGLVHPEFVAAESPLEARSELQPSAEPRERPAEEDELAAGTGAETGQQPEAPYSELDVPAPAEAHEAESTTADEISPIDGPEIRQGDFEEESSIAGARMRPGADAEFDAPLQGEAYESPARGRADGAGPVHADFDVDSSPRGTRDFREPLDFATGIGSVGRPRARRAGPLLWLLAALAAGVAAVILYRAQGSGPRSTAVAPTPSPTELPMHVAETAVLSTVVSPVFTEGPPVSPSALPVQTKTARATVTAAPTRAPATAPPTRAPARTERAIATPRPPTPRPAAPTPVPAASASTRETVPAATRQAWLDRAARDQKKVDADRKAHFTIQVELACEVSTLVDAWKHDRPSGTLWVLTTPFDGKTCFRVLWGRYPTKEAARRALSGVPSFFSAAHNRPVVTAIR